MIFKKKPIFLTIQEVADELEVSKQSIYTWIKQAKENEEKSEDKNSILHHLISIQKKNTRIYLMSQNFLNEKKEKKRELEEFLNKSIYPLYEKLYDAIEHDLKTTKNKKYKEVTPEKILINIKVIDSVIANFIIEEKAEDEVYASVKSCTIRRRISKFNFDMDFSKFVLKCMEKQLKEYERKYSEY